MALIINTIKNKLKNNLTQLKTLLLTFNLKAFIIKSLLAIVVIFMPVYPIAAGMFALTFLDFIAGCWKAKHLGEKITSRRMSHTISKLVLYQLSLIVAYILELITGIPLLKISAGFIALTEGKSFFENVGAVTGTDVWTWIKNFLKRQPAENYKIIDDMEKKEESEETKKS